jgi:hypothetical protein
MDKAKIVETTEIDGRRVNVYDSGLMKDASNGYIVKPPEHTLIDAEKSTELHRLNQQRKQEIMIAAATEAVERGDYRVKYGDLAFAAAIADTAMMKATTPDDPKAIDAARFILQETGLSARQQEAQQGNTTNILVVDADVRRALELLKNMQDAQLHE